MSRARSPGFRSPRDKSRPGSVFHFRGRGGYGRCTSRTRSRRLSSGTAREATEGRNHGCHQPHNRARSAEHCRGHGPLERRPPQASRARVARLRPGRARPRRCCWDEEPRRCRRPVRRGRPRGEAVCRRRARRRRSRERARPEPHATCERPGVRRDGPRRRARDRARARRRRAALAVRHEPRSHLGGPTLGADRLSPWSAGRPAGEARQPDRRARHGRAHRSRAPGLLHRRVRRRRRRQGDRGHKRPRLPPRGAALDPALARNPARRVRCDRRGVRSRAAGPDRRCGGDRAARLPEPHLACRRRRQLCDPADRAGGRRRLLAVLHPARARGTCAGKEPGEGARGRGRNLGAHRAPLRAHRADRDGRHVRDRQQGADLGRRRRDAGRGHGGGRLADRAACTALAARRPDSSAGACRSSASGAVDPRCS